jgi:hypothetical protein
VTGVQTCALPIYNIIYEYTHPLYAAGWRAFHFHFPFGNWNHSWLFDPIVKAQTYTSTTNPAQSPARYKGFKEAIKALLDGTLVSNSPRIAMTDYCDVHLYLTSAGGWGDYRIKANQYWESLPGTPEEKDAAYMQTLDEVVQYYIDMKSEKGILSITLDVASLSATPSDIELYRLLNPSESWGYRSDVVELTNWYFAQKLTENGIPVNCESRSLIRKNKASINNPNINGPTSPIYYLSGWRNFTSDTAWFWYSDPTRAALDGDNNFIDYKSSEDVKWIHHITGSALTLGTRLPWGFSTIVNYNNLTKDISFSGPYTPYWILHQLYMAADTYLNYQYYSTKNEVANEKRRVKTYNTLALDPYICLGQPMLQPGNQANQYAWWNNTGVPNPNIQVMPIFDTVSYSSNPSTYSGNYWTGTWLGDGTGTGSRGWYNSNVRGTNANSTTSYFNTIINIATNYKALNSISSGITMGSASDVYYTNIIDPILRNQN